MFIMVACLFVFWYITKDCFHTSEKVVLKTNNFSLTYLPSERMLRSRCLNRLVFALLKSKALILLFVTVIPFQGFELHSLTVPADKAVVDFHLFHQFFACE